MRVPALFVVLVMIGCAPTAGRVWGPGFHVQSPVGRERFCADGMSSDSTVYDTTQVTQRPLLYEADELRHPSSRRARDLEGRVLLAVTVNADGLSDLASIQTISSPDSDLTRAAVRWLRTADFIPACLNGRAVRTRVVVPVDFKRR